MSLEHFLVFLIFAEKYLFQWLADISTDMRSTSADGKVLVPHWVGQPIDSNVFDRVGLYFSQLPFMADLTFLDSDFWPSVLEVEDDEKETEAAALALALIDGDEHRDRRPLKTLPKGFTAHAKILTKMLERIPPGRLRHDATVTCDSTAADGVAQVREACVADLRDFERLQLEMVLERETALGCMAGATHGVVDPVVALQLSKVEQTALLGREDVREVHAELPRLERRLGMKVATELAALSQRLDMYARAGALGPGGAAPEEVASAAIDLLLEDLKAGSPVALNNLMSLRNRIDTAVISLQQPALLLLQAPGTAPAAGAVTAIAEEAATLPPKFKAFEEYGGVKALWEDWESVAAPLDRADPDGLWRRCQASQPTPELRSAFDRLQKEYSKRKLIIAALKGKMTEDNISLEAAIVAVEAMRVREGFKKLTVYQLREALSAQSVRICVFLLAHDRSKCFRKRLTCPYALAGLKKKGRGSNSDRHGCDEGGARRDERHQQRC